MATFSGTHVTDVPLGNDRNVKKLQAGQEKVRTVLEEFKRGDLLSSSGEKVTDRKQAIAIAMSEAGLDKNQMDSSVSEVLKFVLEDEERELVDIDDVVIMGAGEFDGVGKGADNPYTEQDLKEIEENHRVLESEGKFIPRLSISHEEPRDIKSGSLVNYLAFGGVKNIRAIGKLLYADFKSVPKRVEGFVRDGLLPSKSSELWETVKPEFLGLKTNDGRSFRNVIRRVSLLGHEPPAMWEIDGIVNKYELSDELSNLKVKIYKYSEGENDMSEKQDTMPEDFNRESCLEEIKKYRMDMSSVMDMSDEELFHYKMKLSSELHRRQHIKAGDVEFGSQARETYEEHGSSEPVQLRMDMDTNMEKNGMKRYEQKPEEQATPEAPQIDQNAIKEELKKYQLEADKKADDKWSEKFKALEAQLEKQQVALVKFQMDNQKLEHEKSVDALVAAHKVAPADKASTLSLMERMADVPEVKKYSLNNEEKEGSLVDHFIAYLDSRAADKAYQIEEVAESYGDVKVSASDLEAYAGMNVEAEGIAEYKKIKKYQLDNKCSYAEAYDAVNGTTSLTDELF